MIEPSYLISLGSLVVGVVTLVVAALAFRNSRRSAQLAEDRMEYLREEQARLEFLHEERRSLMEELKREREQRLENQQEAERADRERPAVLEREHSRLTQELEQERGQRLEAQRQAEQLRQEHLLLQRERGQLAEGLEQERAKRLEAQQKARQEREGWKRERSARQQAEQRADRWERELQKLQEDQRESPASGQEGLSEDPQSTPEPLWKKLFPTREAQEADEWTRRPTSPPEARTPKTPASEPTEGQPENEKPKRGIWLPHPDDERDRRNLGKGGGD
jgi:hypothetical protein